MKNIPIKVLTFIGFAASAVASLLNGYVSEKKTNNTIEEKVQQEVAKLTSKKED